MSYLIICLIKEGVSFKKVNGTSSRIRLVQFVHVPTCHLSHFLEKGAEGMSLDPLSPIDCKSLTNAVIGSVFEVSRS